MATKAVWGTYAAIETFLSTELDSLANNARAISSAFSNDDSDRQEMYLDLQLTTGTFGGSRTAAPIAVYILAEVDSVYPYGGTSDDPSSNDLVGSFELPTGESTARVVNLTGIRLPPGNFKILVKNLTGQSMASSGNTVKGHRYYVQSKQV